MNRIRKILIFAWVMIILAIFNYEVLKKEKLIKNGQNILLKLAPVDPRSLMQGDYMVLRYAMLDEIDSGSPRTGKVVISLDENSVASFKRLYQGEALAPGEFLLKYRRRNRARIGAESFFFQEGHAKYYEAAEYGHLKLSVDGDVLLAGLAGKDLKEIKAPAQ